MAALFIILAGVCWGLDGLLRSQVGTTSPLLVVTLEALFACAMLIVIGWRHISWPKLSRNGWYALIGVALFSGLIGTYAFTWAMGHIDYSSFTVIFLLLKLQPIFAIFAALIFLRERPKGLFYLFSLLALIASYFLSFGAAGLTLSFGADALRATIAGLVAAICWGSATVFSRYLSHQGYKARTMTAFRLGMVTLLGFLFLVLSSCLGIGENSNPFYLLPSSFYLLVLGIALLSGVLGTTMYYRGIKHVQASQASIFELSLPLTGFILDLTIHNKTLDSYQWMGALVLVIMMFIVAKMQKS